jgi:hypothetical protein
VLKHLAPIAVVSLLASLAPIAAQAGEYEGDDPTGDVRGLVHRPEPKPCGSYTEVRHDDPRFNDITRLEVEHTATRLHLRLTLRDLPPYQRSSQSFVVRTPDNAFTIDQSVFRGETVVFVNQERMPPAHLGPCGTWTFLSTSNPCRGATGTRDEAAESISVSVPRRCVGAPRWVRVGAESYAGRQGYRDIWAPPGSKRSGPWGHVYGPRVRPAR